jgi:hypothetical protein
MDWSGVEYIGLDAAASVVDANRAKYGKDHVKFEMSPAEFADVPAGDLLLVKDVLQHFPEEAIHRFMAEVVGRFRFCLITNCIEPASLRNRDIEAGDFRPLDLRDSPFNYPAPAVLSFRGPSKISLRPLRKFPAWHKVVLLYSHN